MVQREGVSGMLYARSRWWRFLVNNTQESVPFFLTFSVVTLGACYLVGNMVMSNLTPSKEKQLQRMEKFKREHPTEYKEAMAMADMNKRMLQEYLNDVKSGKDGAWWDFAMKGRSIPQPSQTEDLARALRDR
eukprot:TRINITY_DN3833_c1_g1_i4.p3 TRINITY_DN3833_c1_g1~~TRINITY_DN3833_c1_g1_i4.p3  ORF type:complete len:132 (-),score=16.09 TRINITY_DN3833_c1_g1_i4:134-529(-)